ncbi:AfsR/SARP family transcriptional regulator [Streptacidiphilus sp. P02-A3a]|uniref:AfsR/SARP family transcriptional regulator n=1 Tax=Streptacidiphilus sp. P02-A3a TaxID=2704468 RepID=UPI0015F7F84E|nr:AfsR/SARP family transcriptional regulator [Streptacidiphilus sp. P02-A3a]QMU67647.1 tetratricopeptide repeat protein [Streptacidiphilus sp. P02-A3a]
MRFNLLGPLTVDTPAERIVLRAGIPRSLLLLLLLHANTVVSGGRLAELLWGNEQPTVAAAGLRNHVSRLRRQLGPEAGARIRTVAPGYLVEVDEGELDARVFTDACRRGRRLLQRGDLADATETLSDALLLWRGEPGADLPPGADVQAQLQQLGETRLLALEGRVEAELRLGGHRELVPELRALVEAQPLRESLHGQLMLALYQAGRQAEALDVYRELRRTLIREVGVEPSAPVRELHRRILGADPTLPGSDRVAAVTGSGPGHSGRPAQLPADTRAFTGRGREVEALVALAPKAPRGGGPGTVVIAAVDGMAGIGKSALAIHAAHRLRARFPDGQLFIDLHGHTPGIAPLAPEDALDWFLRSLGVPPQLIPQSLHEKAACYRDRLADTRTLIVLDNAAGVAQVRPLLPATPGCMVLVTSRRRLTGLDDAHALALDLLSHAEAVALLRSVAGPDRLPGDDPATAELIALCGHIPLALRVTGARLRHHPALRLEHIVEQLRYERGRLDYLQDEDRDLTAVFDSSYAALPPAEQRLFGRLALVPGPDVDTGAAAGLTGTDRRTVERLLESLLDHNLLAQHTPGRYRFHDLVRLYARTLSDVEPAAERDTARDRLLDYYLHTAQAGDRHLLRFTRPGRTPAAAVSPAAPRLDNRAAALAWMRAERHNLLAAAQVMTETDPPRAMALIAALDSFLQQQGPWPLAIALHRTAADIALAHGDPTLEANAYHDLGRAHILLGGYPLAAEALGRALELYRSQGDGLGEANTLHVLGRVRHMRGDFPAAVEYQERALELYQGLDDRLGEANALHDLGRTRLMTGEASAAAVLERALAVFRSLDHGSGEANTLWSLGRVRTLTGDYPTATALLHRALAIFRDLGSRIGEANSLHDLGRVQRTRGDHPAAAALLEQSLAIFQDLGFRASEAHSLSELGRLRCADGAYQDAADLQERALASFQAVGNRQGEAIALQQLGRIRHATGERARAAGLLERALAVFQELGDRQGQAETLLSTAALVADTVGPAEALVRYRAARDLAREVRSPLDEARALRGAARCAARTGDRAAALADLRQAVELYQGLGVPEAASATACLNTLLSGPS